MILPPYDIVKIMTELFTSPRRRVLSGLFTNLSAGWIGAVFIFPNFSDLTLLVNKIVDA